MDNKYQYTYFQPNIGKEIKAEMNSIKMKSKDFANKLNILPQNVSRIFERENIDTGLLIEICEILDKNFFEMFFDKTPIFDAGTKHTENHDHSGSTEKGNVNIYSNGKCKSCEDKDKIIKLLTFILKSHNIDIPNLIDKDN